VIDYEVLRELQIASIVKVPFQVSAAAFETFRFKSPYKKANHVLTEYGLNWSDGQIEYKYLHTDIIEVVVRFAHI